MSERQKEVVNLNIDDLDVQGLEERLELAAASVEDCWGHCYECETLTKCSSFDGECTQLVVCNTYDGCDAS